MSSFDSSLVKVVESNTFWDLVCDVDDDRKSKSMRRRAFTDGCFQPQTQFVTDKRSESDSETASTQGPQSSRDCVEEPSDWSAIDTDGEDSLGQVTPLTRQTPPGTWASPHAVNCSCVGSAAAWTTLTVKHLPPQLSQETLLVFLKTLGLGSLDFLYAPSNFRKCMLFGYCFLNFVDHGSACSAMRVLRAAHWPGASDRKVQVAWSETYQGLEAQIERYRNCPVMHKSVPDAYKPMLFSREQRVSFPAPTEVIQLPRNMKKQMR
jgi:hypothetical protein